MLLFTKDSLATSSGEIKKINFTLVNAAIFAIISFHQGLNPDEAVHTTFLNVEPYTGTFWSHT